MGGALSIPETKDRYPAWLVRFWMWVIRTVQSWMRPRTTTVSDGESGGAPAADEEQPEAVSPPTALHIDAQPAQAAAVAEEETIEETTGVSEVELGQAEAEAEQAEANDEELPDVVVVGQSQPTPRSPAERTDGEEAEVSAQMLGSPARIKENHYKSPDAPSSPPPPRLSVAAGSPGGDDSPMRRQEWEEHASHSSLVFTPTARTLEAAAAQLRLVPTVQDDEEGTAAAAAAAAAASAAAAAGGDDRPRERIVTQDGVLAVERTILPQPGASDPARVILPKKEAGSAQPPPLPSAEDAAAAAEATSSTGLPAEADLFPAADDGDTSSGDDTTTTESSVVLVDRPDSPGMKVHNTAS